MLSTQVLPDGSVRESSTVLLHTAPAHRMSVKKSSVQVVRRQHRGIHKLTKQPYHLLLHCTALHGTVCTHTLTRTPSSRAFDSKICLGVLLLYSVRGKSSQNSISDPALRWTIRPSCPRIGSFACWSCLLVRQYTVQTAFAPDVATVLVLISSDKRYPK